MDSTIIYIILGGIVLLNVFFLLFIMKNKKKNIAVSAAPAQEAAPSIPKKHEFVDENVKTQALGSNNQPSPAPVPSKSVPVSDEKTEVLGGGISNLSDMEKQAIRQESAAIVEETVLLGEHHILPEVQAAVRTLEYKEGNQYKTFEWDESAVLSIGRDPNSSELTVPGDNYIGRKHALLYKKDDKYYLVDLDSKNGTFVNNKQLKGQTEVTLNQTFKLGQTEFLLK